MGKFLAGIPQRLPQSPPHDDDPHHGGWRRRRSPAGRWILRPYVPRPPRDTIHDGLGHIQIFTAEHFRRDEVRVLDTGIANWQSVAASVSSGSHVRGVAPRIEFYGMVSNGAKSSSSWAARSIPTPKRAWGSLRIFPRAAISTAKPAARPKPSSAPVWPSR